MNDANPEDTTGKRVLVVDDNQQLLRFVAQLLRGEGFEVAIASDGHIAVEWCEENGRPDLLLTDVCMPEIDGPTLYQRLSSRFPGIPVLFMSATAGDDETQVIAPLLIKPFRRDQLTSMITTSLSAKSIPGDNS